MTRTLFIYIIRLRKTKNETQPVIFVPHPQEISKLATPSKSKGALHNAFNIS